jgi:toxin FitB
VKYLLDTCVVSELVRVRPNRQVVEWVDAQDEEHLFLSVLTIGELRRGIELLASGRKKTTLQNWLDRDLAERFEGRILDVDVEAAERWGTDGATAQRSGRKIPAVDGLIAASAASQGLTVVTRNVKDIELSGVPVFNPWNS